MQIQMGDGGGGGVFELGNPEGRGAQAVVEIQVGGGGSKNRVFRRGGVDFFWNNPLLILTFTAFNIRLWLNVFDS